jgi:hypothetical protein
VVRNGDGLCKKEDSPEGRLGRSIITDRGDQGAKDGRASEVYCAGLDLNTAAS